jgi:hypothetical protein
LRHGRGAGRGHGWRLGWLLALAEEGTLLTAAFAPADDLKKLQDLALGHRLAVEETLGVLAANRA